MNPLKIHISCFETFEESIKIAKDRKWLAQKEIHIMQDTELW